MELPAGRYPGCYPFGQVEEIGRVERPRAARQHNNTGSALATFPMNLPVEPENTEHVYHLYVVRVEDREYLRQELGKRGVGIGLHYPIPLHLQEAYAHLGFKPGSYPNTERSAGTILSLPMHPTLTADQVLQVAEACSQILSIGEKAG